MIIINLRGGLGNQMFQYACGRALSLRKKDSDLKLNINDLKRANEIGDIYRPFSLANFEIKAEIASEQEVRKLRYPYGLVSKIGTLIRTKILRQYFVAFSSGIFHFSGRHLFLDGYFQTERYFIDYSNIIREDLRPKNVSDTAKAWADKIKFSSPSVAVHIRRGDYLGHNVLGGICTPPYYKNAIARICQAVEHPRFFVFSDDIEWVKMNIPFPANTTFVSSPGLRDFEEIYLMSICDHNIIANSSFSWWGAWLNSNPAKIVLAPKKWAHGLYNKWKLRDIIPPTWIKI